ncbi:hypothetical protein BVRB_3g067100 [Beta vulgaris subsp. vulgaris]|nr:hypothetical protein BVRB_3g067100 [Beta vulgaris subsp. vulgaris]
MLSGFLKLNFIEKQAGFISYCFNMSLLFLVFINLFGVGL